MLCGGRTVLLKGQTEHVDVGVLSTLGLRVGQTFGFTTSASLAFYATSYHARCAGPVPGAGGFEPERLR
jgi:hypothetical protein